MKLGVYTLPMSHMNIRHSFLVVYTCPRGDLPVIRAITETDSINAIMAARQEERQLTGVNCPDCVLAAVTLA